MRRFAPNRQLLTALTSALAVISLSAAPAQAAGAATETYDGRSMIVYAPSKLPAPGARALVVVLHGGLGNAQRIASRQSESGLNLDSLADSNGFVVAYLNGTPVTRFFGADKLGWNAGGGCCGQSAENNIRDVDYITGAVGHLVAEYGIDRSHIYGIGHSNGAMMTQRLMCETDLYAAAIAISGPLNLATGNCAAARGKRILAIHGEDDENVPLAGGRGSKGLSQAVYQSEDHTREAFTNSGAGFELIVVKGAEHKLDSVDAALRQSEGHSIGEKAVAFFGLQNQKH
jgi:polyhydroxybutyrate depolymerase